jgi:hypothetical protein
MSLRLQRLDPGSTGFKPHAKLTIWECAERSWIVPADPCNHKNAVKVRTGAHGGFRAHMNAGVHGAPHLGAGRNFAPLLYRLAVRSGRRRGDAAWRQKGDRDQSVARSPADGAPNLAHGPAGSTTHLAARIRVTSRSAILDDIR